MTDHALIAVARSLCAELAPLRFSAPVTHVYNPLEYAADAYAEYVRRYAGGPKRAVFMGMNPGPWGMTQTGIPFGEVASVRDFLKIDVPVNKPAVEHPQRPITGLACTRSEVSGRRVWGAIENHFETPERFFAHYFILNYCPLMFMEATGRNRTPDQLPMAERKPLLEICDRHLAQAVAVLQPEWVIGIGHFAEARARTALAGSGVKFGRIPHPSPASPAANRGWEAAAAEALTAQGLCPMS